MTTRGSRAKGRGPGCGGHAALSRGRAPSSPGHGLPTWERGQAAGEGVALVLRPKPLLQLALQGVELAVAAVDEVLGSPFGLHLDDENLRRTQARV